MANRPQSSKVEARTQAQRERILAAAQTCFVNSGFHAASMAAIAETADMSAGLIYRYFESKNAIILAIIEHQLEVTRCRIQHLHGSSNLAATIVDDFDECAADDTNSMSCALLLEMSAEATRDPQIAAALSRFDATVRSELSDWLRRSRKNGGYELPADVAPGRALMLVCLFEGLKVRGAREPSLDRSLLKSALDEVVATLVAQPG